MHGAAKREGQGAGDGRLYRQCEYRQASDYRDEGQDEVTDQEQVGDYAGMIMCAPSVG